MKQKNVIWFITDQQRSQTLSCNGNPNITTPNLDMLANTGVNFTKAVSNYPLCCPIRGSLLTGLYSHKCVPGHEYPLDPALPTIESEFNKAGYDTVYFGKWHLDGFKEKEGRSAHHTVPKERRGDFNTWVGYENNNSPWDCWVHGHKNEKEIPLSRLTAYETDAFTGMAIDYILERDEDKPFFMIISVQPPHSPYIPISGFSDELNPQSIKLRPNVPEIPEMRSDVRKDLAGYYSMIKNVDWNVGKLMSSLTETDIRFDTHLIFTSDHGDMHGSHGQINKTTAYEEAIRVPFIISGEVPMGYDDRKSGNSTAPISLIDLPPTTLGLCHLPIPDWMEGFDYSHHRIRKETIREKDPDSAYIQSVNPTGHDDSVDKPWRGVVTHDDWKYACFNNCDWLMFHLAKDPYEQVNLVHNPLFKDKKTELIKKLAQWVEKTNDDFLLPEILE